MLSWRYIKLPLGFRGPRKENILSGAAVLVTKLHQTQSFDSYFGEQEPGSSVSTLRMFGLRLHFVCGPNWISNEHQHNTEKGNFHRYIILKGIHEKILKRGSGETKFWSLSFTVLAVKFKFVASRKFLFLRFVFLWSACLFSKCRLILNTDHCHIVSRGVVSDRRNTTGNVL